MTVKKFDLSSSVHLLRTSLGFAVLNRNKNIEEVEIFRLEKNEFIGVAAK